MYWGGRAWQQRGDMEKARAHWRAVMKKDGSSYYSVLSSRRLSVPLLTDSSRTDKYPTVRDITDAAERIEMLEDLGMDTEAKFEYDRLFDEATKSPDRLVATARALAIGNQGNRAITLGRKVVADLGPSAQNFRLLYPVLEREQLAKSAKENGLDPALVAGPDQAGVELQSARSFTPRVRTG
jgi:hypothetical protein